MENAGYAALQIIPSFKGLDKNLEQGTSGALVAAGTKGGTRFGDSAGRSAGRRFASVFGSVARAGLLGAIGGGVLLGAAAFKLGKSSLAEANEALKVGALTTQVIKSTGSAANVTAKQVGDLAEALSNKTGVDDEVIQRGANMLLTFKNVRNEVGKNNDVFDQSVAITEDMAAAMAGGGSGNQLDLKSSSILVGKALGDPVKGLTALTRVGVTFTEQQKEKIASLVEEGDRLQAQKIILGELQSEFGGAAAAQATLGEKVNVAWGNIEERLGTALLPLVHKAQRVFLREGVPAIEGWVDAFTDKGVPAIRHFYHQARPVVEDVLPEMAHVLGTVKDVLADVGPLAKDMVESFNDMPDWAKKAIVGGGAAAVIGGKLGAGSLLKRGVTATVGGGVQKVFETNPAALGAGADLPGGGKKPSIPPTLATFGLASIPLFGALATDKVTPTSNLNSAAPAVGGFAGDAGATVPPGTNIEDFEKVFSDFGAVQEDAKDSLAGFFSGLDTASRTVMGQLNKTFEKLPGDVQTDMVLNGVPESRKAAMDLVRQYDLTPKEKRTLFKTLGIPEGKRGAGDLKNAVNDVPPQRNTHFTQTGASDVIAAAQAVFDAIDNIPFLPHIDVSAAAGRGGSGGGGGGGSDKSGRRTPRSTTGSHRDRVLGDLETFVDDRVRTQRDLDNERQGANR